jgi:ribonuclease HI
MGKQDIYIKVKQITDTSIGNEGEDIRNLFNVPYEDDEEEYNEVHEIGTKYYNPIANIDDAIKALQDAKKEGANFVCIWSHEDHQEIHIESFLIEKLSDEELLKHKQKEEEEKSLLEKRKEEEEKRIYERLKNKFG